ncbi:TonB-dependent receptor [Povalibacter sp.]|uniref:TonB-dependent receptor n=1 Tax=Povalibacter sp. TaxID=1962978 RepID=UPI002F42E700
MRKKSGMDRAYVVAAAFAGMGLGATTVSAQEQQSQPEAQAGLIAEIMVTARKREEVLQDIPLAITAFSSDDMAKRGIQDMRDIAQQSPGFNFEDFAGAGATAPVIRGTTQVAGSVEQNVSFFFDGVYLPRSYVTDLGFSGMERVEVVKGPQSARYGRNAFMGAINYIPKKPTEDLAFEAKATVGNYDRYDIGGSVSGAIMPGKLSVLVGADYSEFDGSWRNEHPYANIDFDKGTDSRSGGHEKKAYNAALRFTPIDQVTMDVSYNKWEMNSEARAQNFFGELGADSQILNCGQWNPDVRPAAPGTTPAVGAGAGGQWNRLYCGEIPLRNTPLDPRSYARQLETDLVRASINWEINDAFDADYVFGRIKGATESLTYKDTLPDCPFIVYGACAFENSPLGDFDSDSHEIRVSFDNGGPIRAAAGMFYSTTTDYSTSNFATMTKLTAVPTQSVDVYDTSQFLLYSTISRNLRKDKVLSPFAEVNYSFMDDRARLGVEARWSREEKMQAALASSGQGVLTITGNTLDGTFEAFTPRVTFDFDLTRDNMLFVSAARGVKSGGFNPAAFLPENRTFDQDSNWTYELGSRNTLANGRVRLNATLFWIDWTDVQIPAADPGNPAVLPVSITRNLGNVNSKGFELEVAVVPMDQLSLGATLYYGDAQYDDNTYDLRWARTPSVCDNVTCPMNGDISGNMMERQSEWQATFNTEWRDDLGNTGFEYFVRGDAAYQSKQYVEAMNLAWVPGRTIANLTTGVSSQQFDVNLWARNLLDKKYVSGATIGSPNVYYNAYLGERRTVGVTLSYRY